MKRFYILSGVLIVLLSIARGATDVHPVRAVRVGVHLHSAQPMQVIAGQTLSFDFVPLSQGPRVMSAMGGGVLNIGAVSYFGGTSNKGIQIERGDEDFSIIAPLGVKIGNTGSSQGTASLKAWLSLPVTPYQVYLDNVPLTLQPKSIDSAAAMGVTNHALKIVIPRSANGTNADFKATIGFEITEN